MISLDKKYKCMNGTDVRIHSFSDTTSPNLPIKGEIFDEGVWRKFFWTKMGVSFGSRRFNLKEEQ